MSLGIDRDEVREAVADFDRARGARRYDDADDAAFDKFMSELQAFELAGD